MKRLIIPAVALLLAGCGEAPIEEPAFTFRLRSGADVIDQIASAAPESVKAQCKTAGGVVRIVNPFRPGEYEDLPCSALGASEPHGEPVGDPSAEPQWSPAGLACGLLMASVVPAIGHAICERGAREHPPVGHPDRWPPEDRPTEKEKRCKEFGWPAGIGLGVMCSILF